MSKPNIKKRANDKKLATISRIASFLGYIFSGAIAIYMCSKGYPWAGVATLGLGVAYANKFTGVEVAAICAEVVSALPFSKWKDPSLPMGEHSATEDEDYGQN
jgi:short-subunit dehydrogenase